MPTLQPMPASAPPHDSAKHHTTAFTSARALAPQAGVDQARESRAEFTNPVCGPACSVGSIAATGSISGRKLGNALLGYLVVTTLLITWAPFTFAWRPLNGLSVEWTASDLVLNVIMFLPLGFLAQASRVRQRAVPWWVVGLAGALLSACIETGQLFIAERYSSLFDVLTNGIGAALGARAFESVRPRVYVGRSTVSALAMELPLTGLALLLVPLLWVSGFASVDTERTWLLLLIAAFGGAIFGAVHGAYLHHTGRVSRTLLLVAVAIWFLVAALPGAATRTDVLMAGATLAIGGAWLRSVAASRARARDGAQRVELPTLRLVLPLFATYFALASLWPLDAIDGVWRGGWTLAPAGAGISRTSLMQALEYLAGFTLVGYVTAELHGRSNASYRVISRRVLRYTIPLVVLLKCARGWNTMIGASIPIALLAILSGVFGGWLYHLQRDHVRTLLARPSAPARRATREARAMRVVEDAA